MLPVSTLVLDFETTSDLNLKVVGAHKYINSENFKILCASFKFNNEPLVNITKDFKEKLNDVIANSKFILAHNTQFEKFILDRLDIDTKHIVFIDTAMISRLFGGPSSLSDCCNFWKLKGEKWAHGLELIKYFNKHDSSHEDYDKNLKDLVKYCALDVKATIELYNALRKYINRHPDYFKRELKYDQDTLRINDLGVPIDVYYTDKLITLRDIYKQKSMSYFLEHYKFNPNSPKQILEWLDNPDIHQTGKPYILSNWKYLTDKQKRMFNLKWSMISPQTKKLDFIRNAVDDKDWKVKGLLTHFGAQTGRYTSRGANILNFPKGTAATAKELDSLLQTQNLSTGKRILESLKGIVKVKDDYNIVSFDYKQIEFRILMHVLGYKSIVKKLESGGDIYLDFAEKIFKYRPSKDSIERQIAKVAVLSLGYGANPKVLVNILAKDIKNPELRIATKAYNEYHKRFPNVRKMFLSIQKKLKAGEPIFNLPNGSVRYITPYKIDKNGEIEVVQGGARYTKRVSPNLVLGNFIQSIARELLLEKQHLLMKEGIIPMFNVYDSLVFAIKPKDEFTKNKIRDIMQSSVTWLKDFNPQVDMTEEERWGMNK